VNEMTDGFVGNMTMNILNAKVNWQFTSQEGNFVSNDFREYGSHTYMLIKPSLSILRVSPTPLKPPTPSTPSTPSIPPSISIEEVIEAHSLAWVGSGVQGSYL
jgi:hypothetical protein